MADKPEFEIDGKQLSQLRVVDLKLELEKRGLPKSGSKKDLHDRLKMQLQLESLQQNVSKDEGHVPNLALQDDAIAEQSDVIKEYLAKQQQVYEMQKQARRQVELEEEMQKSKMLEETSAAQETSESVSETQITEEPVKETADTTLPAAEETAVGAKSTVEESPSTSSDQVETSTNVETTAEEKKSSDVTAQEMKKDIQEEPKEILAQPDIKNDTTSMKVADVELKQPVAKEKQADNFADGSRPQEVDDSSKMEIDGNKADDDNRKLPAETSKDNSNVSEDGNEAKPVEESRPPPMEAPRTLRPRIKREFLYSEASREPADSSKEIAEEMQSKPDSLEVNKQEPVSSAADSSVDIQQETLSMEHVTPYVARRQLKRRSSSNQKEEAKKESRSPSSDSNSSRGRSRSRRKSKSSSSSRSSSVESRKSPASLQQESDSISSSGTTKKRRKHSPIKFDRSPSPASKMSESETRDSPSAVQTKESPEDNRASMVIQDNSVSHMGDDNDDSLDLDAKPEETLDTQLTPEKDVSNNSIGMVHVRKISISSRDCANKENVDIMEGDRPMRKRKWGSTASKNIPKTSYTISTDSLKSLIPDVKPSTSSATTDLIYDTGDTLPSDHEDNTEAAAPKEVRIVRTVTQHVSSNDDVLMRDDEKPKNDAVVQHKPLSLLDDPIMRPRSPSPARNPVNRIIHIRNLVRPFTLKQFKDLLSKSGTLVESGFWIDKIKSKCYATYETIDQARETRQILHGTQWPPSNRKNLVVDFADEDELRFHVNLEYSNEPPKPPEKYHEPPARDAMRHARGDVAPPHPSKSRDFGPVLPPPPIREWDRDKIGERSPGENERRKRMMSPPREKRKEKGGRGMKERKEKRDKRKEEDEAPAKLLDDLFRKTKVTPCIYWLPLTNEQIKLRDEERKQRQVEREKRRQQLKKDEADKGKPVITREVKKAKPEEVTHRKRSSPSSHSRPRKR